MAVNVKSATQVGVDTLVVGRATAGTLSTVKLAYTRTDRHGKRQAGTVAGTSEFRTQALTLHEQTFPTLYPLKGSMVGVGMPVIVTFDVPVKDKAEFEKNLHLTATPRQPGSWHWYSSTEVHFRPKTYWKPGTKVVVDARLNGVNAGDGIYGQNSVTTSFTVGRSVVTKINLQKKRAKVYLDGKLARTIPVSGGKPGFTSRNGTKLIMDKAARHQNGLGDHWHRQQLG